MTDDCGAYNFKQTFPVVYPSRPILHVHFRVSAVTDVQELLVTQMYFEGMVPAWLESSPSRALQIVSVGMAQDGVRSTVVNSPGTADPEICGIVNVASANSSFPSVAPAQEEGSTNPTSTTAPTSTDSSRAYAREYFASFVIVPMALLLFHYIQTLIN